VDISKTECGPAYGKQMICAAFYHTVINNILHSRIRPAQVSLKSTIAFVLINRPGYVRGHKPRLSTWISTEEVAAPFLVSETYRDTLHSCFSALSPPFNI